MAAITCNCERTKQGYHTVACATTRAIYPELVGYICRDTPCGPPAFPDTCPTCGAAIVPGDKADRFAAVEYACGGKYEMKPQIQNHTDYWWGHCGLLANLD